MNKTVQFFIVTMLPFLLLGCGAEKLFTSPYKLLAGSYKINTVTNVNDGCKIKPLQAGDPLTGKTKNLTNDGAGRIALQSFGSGTVESNFGTLVITGTVTDGTCQYAYTGNSSLTVTADNTFSIDYTENQTGRTGTNCDGVTGSCTSSWQMDVAKQ